MKKRLLAIAVVFVLIFTLSACAGNTVSESSTSASVESSVATTEATSEQTTEEETVASIEETEVTTEAVVDDTEEIKVGALKGPTGFGMSKLIDDVENGSSSVHADIQILPTPDKLVPMVVKGELDFACVPTNLAAVLYNKTGGEIEICAVNTLGVLHLVGTEENADKIKSIADLKGTTLMATGKGAVPEYLLNHLIEANGLVLNEDVVVDYSLTHQELAASVAAGENDLAMLPQPFVTIAAMKGENVVEILNLEEEWLKIYQDMPITTGCIIVKKAFLEEHPEAAEAFLNDYKASIAWVNENPVEASQMIEKYGIFPKAKVAEKAIPNCNMVYMDGDEMKESVSGFLNVLFEANPKSVGGSMPAEDFYK